MRTGHLSQSMLSMYESNLYFSSMPTMCNASIITLWSSGVNNVFPFRLEGGISLGFCKISQFISLDFYKKRQFICMDNFDLLFLHSETKVILICIAKDLSTNIYRSGHQEISTNHCCLEVPDRWENLQQFKNYLKSLILLLR